MSTDQKDECRYCEEDQCWLDSNNKLHRLDGPALERPYAKTWFFHGNVHRLDGPAHVRENGDKEWYIDGKRHRLDGPAVERTSGTKEWWINGKLHRLDGPAREWVTNNGSIKQWYVDGKLHRLDGPACEYSYGLKEWYVNGLKAHEPRTELEISLSTLGFELFLDGIPYAVYKGKVVNLHEFKP